MANGRRPTTSTRSSACSGWLVSRPRGGPATMLAIRIRAPRAILAVLLALIATSAWVGVGGTLGAGVAKKGGDGRPLPAPVHLRPEPAAVTLADPAFQPLPGARADFGRLGGSVYQIEVPAHWNGRLVLYMHGYGELRPTAGVSPPGIRRYLIGNGYAWGASSFSSTLFIPGRAADETAGLWDLFARRYGRPTRSYGSRFDGALALCGSAGQTRAASNDADFFVAGAYAAGVTQSEFNRSSDIGD